MAQAFGLVRLVSSDPQDPDFWIGQFQNGNYLYLRTEDITEPDQDMLVLLGLEQGGVYPAPASMRWGSELGVAAIVRHVAPERTIVEMGGSLRTARTVADLSLAAGDIVSVSNDGQIGARIATEADITQDRGETDGRRFEKSAPTGANSEFVGAEVTEQVRRLVRVPIERKREYEAIGVSAAKGVLFVGPPGTGKTMVARSLAKTVEADFFLINGPEMSSRYVGDAELALRNVFKEAGSRDRAIIFFDEIDSVAPAREKESHESGVRLVGMLLTLMDGFDQGSNVMVIGATNRVDSLDRALRRGGRFQAEVRFKLPDRSTRRDIFEAMRASLEVRPTVSTDSAVDLSDGWSGADIMQTWQQAGWNAADEGRMAIAQEDLDVALEQVQRQRIERDGEV